jgi:hypothetical protein
MAANTTRQYQQISSLETSANDGMSVRLVCDLADGLNNAMIYVQQHKVSGQLCPSWWYSHDNTNQERVIGLFAPRDMPMGFTHLLWTLGHVRTAGTGTITWRLYCARRLYDGDVAMQTARLGIIHSVATIVCDSDSHDLPAPEQLKIVRGDGLKSWLVLTAQNETTSDTGIVTCFDVFPTRVS